MKKGIVTAITVAILTGYMAFIGNDEKKIEVLKISENIKAGKLEKDLILIFQNGKNGYINKKGKVILKPEWTGAKYFTEYGYITADGNQNIYIFDLSGKKILEKKNYKTVIPLDKKIFLTINAENKAGLENFEKNLLPSEYIYINNIGDNQYLISKLLNSNDIRTGLIKLDQNGTIKEIFNPTSQGITKINKDIFIVRENNKLKIKSISQENFDYFEIKGKLTYYDSEKIVSELNGIHTLYFFTYGKEASYDYIGSFLYDMAVIKENGKYGLIDKTGKIILEPKYDFLALASSELIIFKEKGKYGYIDKIGKIIIPAVYDEVTPFYKERAMVIEDDKIKIVTVKGDVIKNADYEVITEIKDNIVIGGTAAGFGAVNDRGKEIIKTEYEDMSFWGSKYIKAHKSGKIYIFDYKGKILLKLPLNEKYNFYHNQINAKGKIYFFED